jgi:putative glutamine amidotransferase
MPTLATWVRPNDDPRFAPWFAGQPAIRVENARLTDGANSELEGVDGLLLTGGPDISGEFLRQPIPDPAIIEDAQPERDRWEMAAALAALNKGLPILAICKGVQMLNVALGGTLHLDIPGHRDEDCRFGNLQVLRYDSAAGATPRFERVNSSHHQALDRLGDGLQVEAWHAPDGIIEQVRRRDYPYCLGVQYHPERHEQYTPLFDDFFNYMLAAAPAKR